MQRTRVTRHQHTLGDWVRVRRAPDVRLSGLLLDRELLGYQHSRAQFASWLEPRRPQLTLNREFRELAGTTPSDFVRRLIPDGGVIGDRSPRPRIRHGIASHPMSDQLRPNIFPAVRYRDADAGVAFLTSAFGAVERAVHRGPDGVIHHAELALGAGLVMVGPHSRDSWLGGEAPRPLSSTVSIYAVVDDPDRHRAVGGEAGANVVRELEDMDYGSREYSVRDPEGNLWSFGTYDPYGVGG